MSNARSFNLAVSLEDNVSAYLCLIIMQIVFLCEPPLPLAACCEVNPGLTQKLMEK